MDLGLKGRKALVCASSQGLGLACATALAREGCAVVINGRDAGRLAEARDPQARSHLLGCRSRIGPGLGGQARDAGLEPIGDDRAGVDGVDPHAISDAAVGQRLG